MKKSEFIRNIIAEATSRCAHKSVSDLRIAAEAAAKLVETWWSIDWEPEEPELPERIHATLYLSEAKLANSDTGQPLSDEGYIEAARRYRACPALEALVRDMNRELANRCLRADLQVRARDLGLLLEED